MGVALHWMLWIGVNTFETLTGATWTDFKGWCEMSHLNITQPLGTRATFSHRVILSRNLLEPLDMNHFWNPRPLLAWNNPVYKTRCMCATPQGTAKLLPVSAGASETNALTWKSTHVPWSLGCWNGGFQGWGMLVSTTVGKYPETFQKLDPTQRIWKVKQLNGRKMAWSGYPLVMVISHNYW